MTQEQLEFAIMRHAEGDLPTDEARALEAILEADPAARELLREQIRLTALLRGLPGPDVAWGDLSSDLSAVVTGTVDAAARAVDQKLNAVIRKATPPLPMIRWDALAKYLSAQIDSEMETGGAADQGLAEALRAAPLPDVKWDALAAQISNHIDVSEAQAEERLDTMLRSALAPEVDWDQLSQQIQDRIDAAVADSAERDAADEKLDAVFASLPSPAVKWDALAAHISGKIEEVAEEREAVEAGQRQRMRIGFGAKFVRNVTRMAVAAAVAVVGWVGVQSYMNRGGGTDAVTGGTNQPVAVAVVEGPKREEATGSAVVEIEIGPSKSFAAADHTDDYVSAPRAPIFAANVRVAEEGSSGGFE